MEIVNQHGYLRDVTFLEKKGASASEYCLSKDKTKFIKVFSSKKYRLFQKELEAINTIVNSAGGIDKVPSFILLPEKVIVDGSNNCFVYETYQSTQDIQEYLCEDGKKMDEKLFKKLLKIFLDCFNWMCRHNLAHRDYKMENCLIWFDEFGEATIKIIDFAFVSSYDQVNILGTPNMWPVELKFFLCNGSTGEAIYLENEKYNNEEVKNYFIKCWGKSSLRTVDIESWKKIDTLIKRSDFDSKRRWTVKIIIHSIYTTLFPTESGKYHDMYTLVMLFQQFFMLKDQIKMSSPLSDALQKIIGDKKYLLWSDLRKQFDEGMEELMRVIQTS